MRVEFFEHEFEDDDYDDVQLQMNGPVDPDDPQLTQEVQWHDPAANAFAKFVIVRVETETGKIRVQW